MIAPGAAADEENLLGALAAQRERTLALVAHLDAATLERVIDPLMSPLVWDLGHIAAFEDLWLVHRYGERPLLHEHLMEIYDAFETPRAVRGDVEILRSADALAYLAEVRERTLAVVAERGADLLFHELVLQHEMQHVETMRQTMTLGDVLPPGEPGLSPCAASGSEFLSVPASVAAQGAAAGGFAYDNERPRHDVELPAFSIARSPVTNASWLTFTEGGGYERREWWSAEGWAWKEEYDIGRPQGWTVDGGPRRSLDEPVIHVSWFEADAYARAHGARLPTEAEWERTATWTQTTEEPGGPRKGLLDDVGLVWEWTASRFDGYPGFRAHPYREYSEVFFGGDYRVLRGGSWAAEPRVATPTFRNWDHPYRRQIFAGVRLATEASP